MKPWQEILREGLRKSREEYAAKIRGNKYQALPFDDKSGRISDEQLKQMFEELKGIESAIEIGPNDTVLVLTDGHNSNE